MKVDTLLEEVRFSTEDIENQHNQLFRALQELKSAAAETDAEGAAKAYRAFLDFLYSYFLYHSFTEERLMYENGYPREDYFAHVTEHQEIIQDLMALREGDRPTKWLEVDAATPRKRAEQLAQGFHDWIDHHIAEVDAQLLDFLQGRGL